MASSSGNALALIKAVLDLVAERRTGVLDVRSDTLRTRIYFDDGTPLFAEDDALGETFGRLLMRQGVITNDQFVQVIDEMTRAAIGNSQLRFGEVAIRLGVLTHEQVERGLAEQVCGIITRALQRGESEWTFETSPRGVKPVRWFALEINPAVLEALKKSSDRAMVADVVAARPEEFVVIAGARPAPAPEVREEVRTGNADTHTARMTAEQTFQRGLALLHDGKTASAAVELRRAAELLPESLEYLLYATWARARSYREVPVESDQQTLLEIAHKAKRHDPMLAFASYVLGELSMWAGDEAAAKKWFYEALRLDPASEAGKEVRILARRKPAPPAQADVQGPPERDTVSDAAPVPAREPPAQVRTPAQASAAPPRRRSGFLGASVALVATAGIVIFLVTRKPPPSAGLEPSPPPQPALSAESPSPVDKGRKEEAPAPPSEPAAGSPTSDLEQTATKKEVKATTGKEPGDADPEMGTVVLPSRASGHRIFVDGRRVQIDGTGPLRLRCGAHTIQIGSSGTPESIDLPCRGEVQLQ